MRTLLSYFSTSLFLLLFSAKFNSKKRKYQARSYPQKKNPGADSGIFIKLPQKNFFVKIAVFFKPTYLFRFPPNRGKTADFRKNIFCVQVSRWAARKTYELGYPPAPFYAGSQQEHKTVYSRNS